MRFPHLILISSAIALLSTTVLLSVPLFAQDSDSTAAAIRRAGDEAHFRVIQRFPEESPALDTQYLLEEHPAISQALDTRSWSRAHQLIAQELGRKTSSSVPPRWKFLAGYVAHQAGHHHQAVSHLSSLDETLPVLADYIHFYRASSAFEINDSHGAALDASRVPENSRLYAQSLVLLARALLAEETSSDIERAQEIMTLYLGLYPNASSASSIHLLLAQSYESQKQWDKAAAQYLLVRNQFPLASDATTARQKLSALREQLSDAMKARIDAPSHAREIRRFRGLFERHRSETLVEQLPTALDTWPKGSVERCEGLFLVGRSYTNLRQHDQSTAWYERVLKECAHTEFHIRALYLGGRGLWNSGQRTQARAWFERIWTEYPEHSFSDDAMFFSARILRDEGQHDASRKLLRQQVRRYPDGDMAKDAHWLLVREMFENKSYQAVVTYIDGLVELGEDDLYSRGRLHYFRARALELQQRRDASLEAYHNVITTYPKTYYALLAFHRVAAVRDHLKDSESAKESNLCNFSLGAVCDELTLPVGEMAAIVVPQALMEHQTFQRGKLLLELGLGHAARQEFSSLRSSYSSDADTLWALAYYLDKAKSYPISHDIARRSISNWMNAYPSSESRKRWEVAFPTPFRTIVNQYAEQRKLPQALVFAIMREESGFNPTIESWANARGLLQLMEPVAKNLASKDNLGNISAAELLNPDVNIRLGTALLEELSGQLNQHPALVIAGYNGGYGNVARWVRERGDLPLDLWVEDIPFGQTRNYTKRVLTSFWTYSLLYYGNHVPYLDFSVK